MSKGTNFMCDGISGGGAKWFVALLPEVGKIDTRLWSCGREPPQPGPLINKPSWRAQEGAAIAVLQLSWINISMGCINNL